MRLPAIENMSHRGHDSHRLATEVIAPEDRHRSWQIRQPAPQSKLRELRQWAHAVCFVPVTAINKPVFLAEIENNRDFPLSHGFDFQAYNRKRSSFLNSFRAPPRGYSMICNLLIIKQGLKNEQQINKQLFSITVL